MIQWARAKAPITTVVRDMTPDNSCSIQTNIVPRTRKLLIEFRNRSKTISHRVKTTTAKKISQMINLNCKLNQIRRTWMRVRRRRTSNTCIRTRWERSMCLHILSVTWLMILSSKFGIVSRSGTWLRQWPLMRTKSVSLVPSVKLSMRQLNH
jgi:hypothetical protein